MISHNFNNNKKKQHITAFWKKLQNTEIITNNNDDIGSKKLKIQYYKFYMVTKKKWNECKFSKIYLHLNS